MTFIIHMFLRQIFKSEPSYANIWLEIVFMASWICNSRIYLYLLPLEVISRKNTWIDCYYHKYIKFKSEKKMFAEKKDRLECFSHTHAKKNVRENKKMMSENRRYVNYSRGNQSNKKIRKIFFVACVCATTRKYLNTFGATGNHIFVVMMNCKGNCWYVFCSSKIGTNAKIHTRRNFCHVYLNNILHSFVKWNGTTTYVKQRSNTKQ